MAHTVINRRRFIDASREKRRLLWSWRCTTWHTDRSSLIFAFIWRMYIAQNQQKVRQSLRRSILRMKFVTDSILTSRTLKVTNHHFVTMLGVRRLKCQNYKAAKTWDMISGFGFPHKECDRQTDEQTDARNYCALQMRRAVTVSRRNKRQRNDINCNCRCQQQDYVLTHFAAALFNNFDVVRVAVTSSAVVQCPATSTHTFNSASSANKKSPAISVIITFG